MKCSLGYPQCQFEFHLNAAQVNEAYRRAEGFDTGKNPFGMPSYPYVWRADRANGSIRLEMGYDIAGLRIIAAFTFRARSDLPGVTVHVAVWRIDEKLARQTQDITGEEWVVHFSMNVNYHTEAVKHFRGALLRMPLGTNSYVVAVPQEVVLQPQNDETALPPPSP